MKSHSRPQRAPHVPDGRRDRDDDLLLFRELFKREEQRNVNLLDPVSVDFEATGPGGNQLYRIPSKKGSDFLPLDSEKNDFDWLKTPPATPLFPSLEMEATNPSSMHYKEAHNFLKPSRFAVKHDDPKTPASPGSRSASSQSDASSSRSATPSRRSSSSSSSALTLREAINQKNKTFSTYIKRSGPTPVAANAPTKSLRSGSNSTAPKTQSRRVSPQTRSAIPGFTNEAPPNLVTSVGPGRASSASRGRPVVPVETKTGLRRQSCSPGGIRGRKQAEVGASEAPAPGGGTGGNLVMGSRMVEKMMNARRSAGSVEEMKTSKAKQRGVSGSSPNEAAGFGRLMSRSSMDVAYQHMEIRKSSNEALNMGHVKSSSPAISYTSTVEVNIESSSVVDVKKITTRKSSAPENKSLVSKKAVKVKRCGFC